MGFSLSKRCDSLLRRLAVPEALPALARLDSQRFDKENYSLRLTLKLKFLKPNRKTTALANPHWSGVGESNSSL
jgi:hypothetical protein